MIEFIRNLSSLQLIVLFSFIITKLIGVLAIVLTVSVVAVPELKDTAGSVIVAYGLGALICIVTCLFSIRKECSGK